MNDAYREVRYVSSGLAFVLYLQVLDTIFSAPGSRRTIRPAALYRVCLSLCFSPFLIILADD